MIAPVLPGPPRGIKAGERDRHFLKAQDAKAPGFIT